eukprot:933792-Pyramimonas_sp.AAC.1
MEKEDKEYKDAYGCTWSDGCTAGSIINELKRCLGFYEWLPKGRVMKLYKAQGHDTSLLPTAEGSCYEEGDIIWPRA